MSSTELPICHESNVRAGEALDNLRETPFLNWSSSFRSIKPLGLSRILLRPVIKLSFDAKQEHAHLAKDFPFGELLLVMKVTKWSFAHNVADQASFLVCLLACCLGGLPPLHRPALRYNPPMRFAGCQQQDLTGPAFADTPREDAKLQLPIKLTFRHPYNASCLASFEWRRLRHPRRGCLRHAVTSADTPIKQRPQGG